MARPGWSLRLRVALAFLLTTAIAVLALGVFVHWRVQSTLEEGLRDQLQVEMDRLVALPPEQRGQAVAHLSGELYAQLQTTDGEPLSSSTAVVGRLVDAKAQGDGYSDATIRIVDEGGGTSDDDASTDGLDTEADPALVLVRTEGEQVLVVAVTRDDSDNAVRTVRNQLLVSGPIALLLAGLLGYLVAGLGLRPVERMRARAATISSRSAGERLPVPSAVELRRLAVTLNAMLDRLDEGLDRERRFVADASHELRTPLALLLTEVELALSGERTPEELREALRSVEEEVRRLISLSEDLLALASADAGHLPLAAEQVDLVVVVRDVVRRFEATAAGDGRPLVVGAAGPVLVAGDADRLTRVVSNLVDNALRHGAGAVAVDVGSDGSEATIAVSDEGRGFDEERPLERFAGSHGSTGLGLAIVDEVVRAHGGTIELGRADGRTVVRVRLPVSRY